MRRGSLNMKLVLIMVLLIVSLMTVVGAFLTNSVVGFYLRDFYTQINEAFSDETSLWRDLRTETEGEEDGARHIKAIDKICGGAIAVNSNPGSKVVNSEGLIRLKVFSEIIVRCCRGAPCQVDAIV